MESSDECHALLRVACLPLNDYGSQRTLTTTGHCNLVVLDESGGGCCESADVIIVQHEMTSTTTEPTHTVGRKSSDQRLEQSKVPTRDIETNSDVESIVKLRLFLATAALWIVWLLLYVILSYWRFI
ncbi:hypothetical protein OUZ56_008885 [Daphnia magna]|uniref:Uncharacterized protein n=1 Tax=Daphnia magna TaxID=35525 RepID=A0ABR0AEC7_9CRUS|nr:hypothetical protein OUZ56_008885 [Daphnia magna]